MMVINSTYPTPPVIFADTPPNRQPPTASKNFQSSYRLVGISRPEGDDSHPEDAFMAVLENISAQKLPYTPARDRRKYSRRRKSTDDRDGTFQGQSKLMSVIRKNRSLAHKTKGSTL